MCVTLLVFRKITQEVQIGKPINVEVAGKYEATGEMEEWE